MTAPFPPPRLMPPEAPLAMPVQNLRRPPDAPRLPPDPAAVQAARVFVFGVALAITLALGLVMYDWFMHDGLIWVEAAILLCGMFAAFWIALSVATALLGLVPCRTAAAPMGDPLDIAIVQPIYGEPIGNVLGNTLPLLSALAGGRHRYTFYVLSDTRDPSAVRAEHRAVARVAALRPDLAIHYRHRPENTRFKAGNLADWVTRWGAAHDAMLVLDADSVMSPGTVTLMADRMAGSARLGLVQSIPRLIGARSIFARAQAFANTVYGTTLSRGLGLWSGSTANYWGHNALIRTRAFAAAAGLPDLPGRRPFGGVILSHDFVEAALLRRAGWQISFAPEATGSFEGTPETVLAHALRDRRWCQGNLQHLRLLGTRGLHPLSRMHMFQGAMAYLSALVWFALMILWVLAGRGAGDGAIRYFSDANPLFPTWPEMDMVSRILIVALIYGMLIAPKVLGALAFWAGDPTLRSAGGPLRFVASALSELVLSVMLAPMMMIQHMIAVLRTLSGVDTGWAPAGGAERHGPLALLRFHAVETGLGLAMCVLFALDALTLWLLPIGILLALAPLLSWAASATPPATEALFWTPQDHRHEKGAAPDAVRPLP
ncbi:glucans biosynthesis glucosyltransferase MdoH [Oceanibium sediminis]|uniref:glucans biosynthesis glucosyltransferase MdoH n=1 Tax=Oceanibium sediminis TaxID=2026339 RepID=UPI000DD430B5|nr:glucans biosynthesis glucosyltransferase MdoH [Oceanibium sediminis]